MIGATCPCGPRFQVTESLKGGLATCPACPRAVTIRGGPEPLFWILFAGGALLVSALAGIAGWQFGWVAGAVVLGASAAILGATVLLS